MGHFFNRAWARRVAARAAGEAGDTMIEVVLAILVVGLLAGATFAGFSSVADLNAQQRHEAQANQLAQQDEDRLRGLSPFELAASYSGSCGSAGTAWQLYGNECHQTTLDGTTYSITSSASYVAQGSGAASCTQGGSTSSADDVATQSEVTWTGSNGQAQNGVTPVIEHSLISPPGGGAVIAYASSGGTSNSGVAGVQFTIEGPSPSTNSGTLTTDSNGCAVFGGLAGGNYKVTMSDSRYLTYNGVLSQYPTLAAGGTEQTPFTVGLPGAISTSFNTYQNGSLVTGVPWDTFSISGGGVSPEPGPFGTTGTTATTVSSTQTLFPTTYSAWAGNCSADDPGGSTGTSGATGQSGSYVDPTVTVPGGATGNVTATVPSMLLNLSESSAAGNLYYDDAPSADPFIGYTGAWSHITSPGEYDNTDSNASAAGATATLTFTGTGVEWVGPTKSSNGYAEVYLDGALKQHDLSTYSSSTTYGVNLYSISGLSNTTHTLEIYVDGAHPTGSSGNTVNVDYFLVTVAATSWNVNSSTLPYQVATYDSCPTPVYRTVSPQPTPITASGSTVYPVLAPYGNSVQVCFQNTVNGIETNTGALPSGATQISNVNLNGTTVTPLTLPLVGGATGASAVFSNLGACPT